ncbi:MAG: GAF domain-containing protein, partial [Acidobacteriota bacterium]
MDLETTIRTRIEALLVNDAKKYADLQTMVCRDEPFEEDPFGEERNLYQRVISSYRSAVHDVNRLLEENIAFLSTFARIVESIKDRDNFQEICSVVVDALLQDVDTEYCSIILFAEPDTMGNSLYLEGIREQQQFIFIHPNRQLLGNKDFERVIAESVVEARGCLFIPDVYKETRFNGIDFSSVVRSLVTVPIVSNGQTAGVLLVSHSLPQYFNENHLRLLKVLAGIIAHSKYLLDLRPAKSGTVADLQPPVPEGRPRDAVSIILFSLDDGACRGGSKGPDRELILSLRSRVLQVLEPGDAIMLYDDRELLLLSPGTTME